MLSLNAVTTPPKYNPLIPSVRRICLVMPQLDAAFEEVEIWARHLISSVGVLTTQVARPPIAPASQVVQRLGGAPVVLEFRSAEVRL